MPNQTDFAKRIAKALDETIQLQEIGLKATCLGMTLDDVSRLMDLHIACVKPVTHTQTLATAGKYSVVKKGDVYLLKQEMGRAVAVIEAYSQPYGLIDALCDMYRAAGMDRVIEKAVE